MNGKGRWLNVIDTLMAKGVGCWTGDQGWRLRAKGSQEKVGNIHTYLVLNETPENVQSRVLVRYLGIYGMYRQCTWSVLVYGDVANLYR